MTWKRIAAWSAVAVLALVVLLFASAAVLLHSEAFHRYLLGKVQQSATESLNTPVRLQNFALHFSPLSVDLYGVTVTGNEPETEPPLLTVDHVKVGITIVSLLRLQWNLNDIEVDHPVAHLLVNEQRREQSSGAAECRHIADKYFQPGDSACAARSRRTLLQR